MEQIADERFGVIVALTPSSIALVELVEAVDKILTVPPDSEIVCVRPALWLDFGSQ